MIKMTTANQTQNSEKFEIDCGATTLHLSDRTQVMGILNVTPDSFSDGGQYFDTGKAVKHAFQMVEEGADIIDIGGESSRPGAKEISADEELGRVIPVIEKLNGEIACPISIDTRKAEVARVAIEAGAGMINDISGLTYDPDMISVVCEFSVPVVVMHMRGMPRNMQKMATYRHLISDIYNELQRAVHVAIEGGVPRNKIVIDPGIGFGKRAEDNFVILRNLNCFHRMHLPLLIGVSRKSFIGWKLNLPEGERMFGTAAAVAMSVLQGAHIVRVHDVKEMVQVVRIIDQIKISEREAVIA
jgi:dihydropteroate synthase